MNFKSRISIFLAVFLLAALVLEAGMNEQAQWHTLFDGKSLEGWRSNDETLGVFTIVEGGVLQVKGGRAHLFWVGRDGVPPVFTNFELHAKVKTTAGSNSGIFFHTKFQESGWPQWGLEAQVNSTHQDRRKTGSIYAIQDVLDDAPSKDGEWFDYALRVEGKHVTISVNGSIVNTYTEPKALEVSEKKPHIRLGQGTIAIQGHDPKSTIFYREIRLRILD